ncbi:MAG: HAD-IA family hydrolase [Alphaproteobacteria bacterium]|nr:HAD-IA family hydrolase [Alphaproteobacteria bacterium]
MVKQIKNLVFDLDYTLYPSSTKIENLFRENARAYLAVEMKMSSVEIEKAFEDFGKKGSMLRGAREGSFNVEHFFNYICDVDVSAIDYNPELHKKISSLPHCKIVFTNSSRKHTKDVLKKLKISDQFKYAFSAEDSEYYFKPELESFDKFFKHCCIVPQESVFFEDNLRNLERAKALGMMTVLISSEQKEKPDFCDYVFADINQALNLFE